MSNANPPPDNPVPMDEPSAGILSNPLPAGSAAPVLPIGDSSLENKDTDDSPSVANKSLGKKAGKSRDMSDTYFRDLGQKQVIQNYYYGQVGVVAGDQTSISDVRAFDQARIAQASLKEETIAAAMVRADEMAQIDAVYIEPPNYADIKSYLHSQHLVVVNGQKGIGKRATALYIAARVANLKVYNLSPNTDLSVLIHGNGEDETCYVMDGAAVDFLEKEVSGKIRQIQNHLRKIRSYLIITVNAATEMDFREVASMVITLKPIDPAARVTCLENHIRFFAKENEQFKEDEQFKKDVLALIKQSEVTQALTEVQTNQQIALLARALLHVVRGKIDLKVALARVVRLSYQEMETWFLEECTTGFERAFLISLAGFSGVQTGYIWNIANMLVRMTSALQDSSEGNDPASDKEDKDRIAKKTTVNQLQAEALTLKHCRCQREPLVMRTEVGETQTDTLRFENDIYRLEVLQHVWAYDTLRGALCAWLNDIGLIDSSDAEQIRRMATMMIAVLSDDEDRLLEDDKQVRRRYHIRIQAAAASGVLAGLDFEAIERQVWKDWVNSEDPPTQALVGVALRQLLGDSRSESKVLNLLKHWASIQNESFQRTAVIAYGYIGMRYPAEAMNNLRLLFVKVNNPEEFAEQILEAIDQIFNDKQADVSVWIEMIRQIAQWGNPEHKADTERKKENITHRKIIQVLANRAFINVAANKSLILDQNTKWPLVVWLSAQSEDWMNLIVTEYRRAFQRSIVRTEAKNNLEFVCRQADGKPDSLVPKGLRRATQRLLGAMWDASDESERERFLGYFRAWKTGKEPIRFLPEM